MNNFIGLGFVLSVLIMPITLSAMSIAFNFKELVKIIRSKEDDRRKEEKNATNRR